MGDTIQYPDDRFKQFFEYQWIERPEKWEVFKFDVKMTSSRIRTGAERTEYVYRRLNENHQEGISQRELWD